MNDSITHIGFVRSGLNLASPEIGEEGNAMTRSEVINNLDRFGLTGRVDIDKCEYPIFIPLVDPKTHNVHATLVLVEAVLFDGHYHAPNPQA